MDIRTIKKRVARFHFRQVVFRKGMSNLRAFFHHTAHLAGGGQRPFAILLVRCGGFNVQT